MILHDAFTDPGRPVCRFRVLRVYRSGPAKVQTHANTLTQGVCAFVSRKGCARRARKHTAHARAHSATHTGVMCVLVKPESYLLSSAFSPSSLPCNLFLSAARTIE